MRILLLAVTVASVALLQTTMDINERLARWQQVKMPFNNSGLSAREMQMIQKLIEASQYLDRIYWRQNDPDALALYRSSQDANLRRLIMIHGSRFDLLDEKH